MKKILITGANGFLGQKLVLDFFKWYSVLATGQQKSFVLKDREFFNQALDITDKEQVKSTVKDFRPELIINTAAYIDVEGCEVNKELAWGVNVEGVKNLIEVCQEYEIKLIQISTDYVFDGKNGPYSEDDKPNPICYYGGTKLQAEEVIQESGIEHLIVRSNVLYGTGKKVKKNFYLWVYENLSKNKPLQVVTDQFNNPTLADNFSILLLEAVEKNLSGVLHLAGSEYLSRFDFALKIAEHFNFDKSLISPILTSELNQKAQRPLKGGLKIDRAKNILTTPFFSVTNGLQFLKDKIRVKKNSQQL